MEQRDRGDHRAVADAGVADAGVADAGVAGWMHDPVDDGVDELAFTEAELTELALVADPSAPLDDDAVPVAQYLGDHAGLLPSWYMPTPMVRSGPRWRIPVVVALVAAFVIIEAFGLCSTFGQLVPA